MPSFLRALRRPAVLLPAGAVLFLAARLWLVWLGALTGPFPRNGADALTYLWRGGQINSGSSAKFSEPDQSNMGGMPDDPGARQYVHQPGSSLICTPARCVPVPAYWAD